jgi:hypothetical protein
MAVQYTQMAIQIPNGYEIHQIFHPKAFRNVPKLVFLVRKKYHLATLPLTAPPLFSRLTEADSYQWKFVND